MLKNVVNALMTLIFIVGILGSGNLVLKELKTGNGCPKVWIIPACAIIFICFIIPFIANTLKKWNRLYFFFTGLAFIIACAATILQYIGKGECPKTSNGIPMCYYSLLIFASLILLKIYQQKTALPQEK